MKNFLLFASVAMGLLGPAAFAAVQVPVAVVEDVNGKVAGVEFMDYVAPGTKIELGPAGSIVLSYLKSCRQEVITGGTVTIGTEQSSVDHGKVERTAVHCDANHIRLDTQEANQSAATVFRALAPERVAAKPQITLYGRSPIVETNGPGTLTIERLDPPGESYEIGLSEKSLDRGRFYDFAKANKVLAPGATYRASFGRLSIAFKIDSKAELGSTPIIGRLLRFTTVR